MTNPKAKGQECREEATNMTNGGRQNNIIRSQSPGLDYQRQVEMERWTEHGRMEESNGVTLERHTSLLPYICTLFFIGYLLSLNITTLGKGSIFSRSKIFKDESYLESVLSFSHTYTYKNIIKCVIHTKPSHSMAP